MNKQNLKDVTQNAYPIISEEKLNEYMNDVAVPFLNQIQHSFYLKNPDGHKIYGEYYKRNDTISKGSIMISHGFTESCDKYKEIIYYLYNEGYNICIMDHRNHGRSRDSQSENSCPSATHINHFQDYVNDLNVVIENALKKELPGPYYLYAHSMGGAIAALYLEQHPNVFSKVVLNAPMFEINRGGLSYVVAKTTARILCLLGKREEFLPGQQPFSPQEDFENSATNCYTRYRYYYDHQCANSHLQNGGSSCGWTLEAFKADEKLLKKKNCAKIKIPILLFQAEHDTFVLPGGQDLFIEAVPNGRTIFVPDAKHEIYLSKDDILKYYITAILNFFEPQGRG